MKYSGLLVMILLLSSCHNIHSNEKAETEGRDTIIDYDTSAVDPAEKTSSCYESIAGKDTVYLSLFNASEVITGSLQYRHYEKDNNNGSIQGSMEGDTLFAKYIFMSEGKASVREVAFLKQGDNFIEGYGDVEDQHGKTVFRNRDALQFTGASLLKVNCTNETGAQ